LIILGKVTFMLLSREPVLAVLCTTLYNTSDCDNTLCDDRKRQSRTLRRDGAWALVLVPVQVNTNANLAQPFACGSPHTATRFPCYRLSSFSARTTAFTRTLLPFHCFPLDVSLMFSPA
jgi:hypothetical protein